jgi:hypothetical protein
MKGVTLHTLAAHTDARGTLHALERGGPLRFQPERIFIISECPTDAVRACHAVSGHQALMLLNGRVDIDLDNGAEQCTFTLPGPHQLLALEPGVWLRLRDFSPDAILMVASSKRYAEVRYFDTPQPDLMGDDELAAS